MRPSVPLRTWAQRMLRLGPSRLALALAVLLALVAFTLPFWSLASVDGNEKEISSFSWATVATERYVGGTWDGTEILPYSSTAFFFRALAGVLGTAYVLDLVFVIVAAVVLALFSMDYLRTMPTVSMLVISLLVVGVGLLAVFYPVVAVPGAATTDLGTFTIGGFWGATRTATPTRDWSWGPGLGWWLLLLSVVLGIVGAVLPYLKSIRVMAPAARPLS